LDTATQRLPAGPLGSVQTSQITDWSTVG